MREFPPEIDDEPLEHGWKPTTLMDVPAEMVAAIAMGMEEPDQIAYRHGFTPEQWEKLVAWKPFQDAVATQRADFEKSGLTFRLKQAMKADMLADKVFVEAMGPDVSFVQRMEALKTFAKLGNLEPKDEKQQQGGTTFAISIDLGDRSVQLTSQEAPKPLTIDTNAREVAE